MRWSRFYATDVGSPRAPVDAMERGPKSGIITALVAKGRGHGRVTVYLDGVRAFDVSVDLAAKAGLHKDEWLSEARWTALVEEDEPERAREIALAMVARREVCSCEVVDRLVKQGIAGEVALGTVAWLCERGYVDDRRYASAYAASKLKAGWGRRRIVTELLKRGLKRDLVAGDAWEALVEPRAFDESLEAVIDLVRRRFGGQLVSDPAGAKRRVGGFLARRGHDWDTISAVWRALGDS